MRNIRQTLPELDLKNIVHIVQHANWNEEVTTPEDLAYVNEVISYHKIPDGNAVGNGTPGFKDAKEIEWRQKITDPKLISIWEMAIELGNKYNGSKDRYLNEAIKEGGLDFSDVCESAWIFGFAKLVDSNDFFREFASKDQN